jgi:hypothetical protein
LDPFIGAQKNVAHWKTQRGKKRAELEGRLSGLGTVKTDIILA